jgi:hypothetical protein
MHIRSHGGPIEVQAADSGQGKREKRQEKKTKEKKRKDKKRKEKKRKKGKKGKGKDDKVRWATSYESPYLF